MIESTFKPYYEVSSICFTITSVKLYKSIQTEVGFTNDIIESRKQFLEEGFKRETVCFEHDWHEGNQIKVFLTKRSKTVLYRNDLNREIKTGSEFYWVIIPKEYYSTITNAIKEQIIQALIQSNYQLEYIHFLTMDKQRALVNEDQLRMNDPLYLPKTTVLTKEFQIIL